jgi:hypothetical protein
MNNIIIALQNARARIERGWLQNGFSDGQGNVCPYQALILEGMKNSYKFFESVLPAWADGSILYFNDDVRTTKSDVLALFDRAIESELKKLPPKVG